MEITVFGAGSPSEEGLKEAEELGRKIAKSGHILKNGGYHGTMKSSAKGCMESGGKCIGVCVKGHKFATEGKPNEFISEVILKETLHERLLELINTDIIVVLEGSIGTLEELFVVWAENLVNEASDRKTLPIYLVGKKNRKLINFLFKEGFVNKDRLTHIKLVDSINDLEFLKGK